MTTITLLDGGMGQELRKRSKFPATPIWSTQVVMDEPEIVEGAHLDFIKAGAEVIALTTYTATQERLRHVGLEEKFEELHLKAVEIAKSARDKSGKPVKIAGCLPPLVASYRHDVVPDFDRCRAEYQEIVDLDASHVDLFMAETLSTLIEVKAATQAAKSSGKTIWVGMTVDDGDGTKIRSGATVKETAQLAKDEGADAIMVNCSVPEAVTVALQELKDIGIPYGAYANGFVSIAPLEPGGTVDGLKAREDLNPTRYADFVDQWIAMGATIVGGCCEVGPAHIAEIAKRVR